jgi:hypothetical protein
VAGSRPGERNGVYAIQNRESKQNQQLTSVFPSSLPKASRRTDAASCGVWSNLPYHLQVRLSQRDLAGQRSGPLGPAL